MSTLQWLGRMRRHGDRLSDFSDTAALLELMDLAISVDTAVAHLAGAMGKPVWLVLPFSPDHRWVLDPADSPRHPTATPLHQSRPSDWSGVVAEVMRRLACLT